MKVLELYSGIGGMHLALKASGVPFEVKASVDINTTANDVYRHNFPETPLLNRNIQSLTSDYVNKLDVDTILMSPPCQPFTRVGLKKDIADARTESFVHLLRILNELSINNILLENVKGFETSEMHRILKETLSNCRFECQEFILSPMQFGVPNMRQRYYLLAHKCPGGDISDTTIHNHIPSGVFNEPHTIEEILDDTNESDGFLLPETILRKHAMVLDIRTRDSRSTCCFTKAYGRFVEGTGSVFTPRTKSDVDATYEELQKYDRNTDDYFNCLKNLRLRFFTPREVSRLMSFPETFTFPDGLSNKKKYMLLGNSINVKVVSELIKLLDKYFIGVFVHQI